MVAGDAGGDENDAAAKMDGGGGPSRLPWGIDRASSARSDRGAARADALGFFLGVFLVRPVFGFGSLEPGANAPGANAPAPVAANGPPRGPASPNVGNVGGLAAGRRREPKRRGVRLGPRPREKRGCFVRRERARADETRGFPRPGGSLDPNLPSSRGRPGTRASSGRPSTTSGRAPLARRPPPDPRLNDRLENSVTGGVANDKARARSCRVPVSRFETTSRTPRTGGTGGRAGRASRRRRRTRARTATRRRRRSGPF